MGKSFRKPASLREVLEDLFARSGWDRRMREQNVLDSWKKIVGEGIARQTQPLRVQNQVLQVKVSHPVWMQQLHFMKEMIFRKIQGEAGGEDIRGIRFFLGELTPEKGAEEGGGEGSPERRSELTGAEKEQIQREVANLADPEMREVFTRVFTRAMAAKKDPGRDRRGQ